MKDLVYSIIQDLKQLKNIDFYILIPFAFVLSLGSMFSFFTVEIPFLLEVSILLWAVLVISQLNQRKKTDKLSQDIEFIANSVDPQNNKDLFVSAFDDNYFKTKIINSKTLTIVGTHISSFLLDHNSILEDKARRGDKMQFLLISPNGNAAKMSMMRFPTSNSNKNQEKQRILGSIDSLLNIKETCCSTTNNIEIKTLDFLIDYTGYMIDDDVIFIEHHTYKISGGNMKPKSMYCYNIANNSWYKHLSTEILMLWKDGVEYKKNI